MKIAVDARMFLTPRSGVGQYVAALLWAFCVLDKENQYYLYSPRDFDWEIPDGLFTKRIVPSRRNRLWMQYILPYVMKKDGIDLFWGGNYVVPFMPPGIKKVVTVHDLVFRIYPQTLQQRTFIHLKTAMPFYLRFSDHVIVVSNSTAKDLQKYYPVPDRKITVTYGAAREDFFREPDNDELQTVLEKHGLEKGYLLYVGTVEPRKGIDTIIKALDLYGKENGQNLCLVIAGQMGWETGQIKELLSRPKIESMVRFLDYVPDKDLPVLYRGAAVFIYPSLYEGFGLPVVEAMASGVPVITSNISSLPEVGGDAVLYIEPGDEIMLCRHLEQLLANPVLWQELSLKGKQQAARFNWHDTARKTLQVFENLLGMN